MVKQKRKKVLGHNRAKHNVYMKILESLKRENFILSFTPLHRISNELEYFLIEINNRISFKIIIWKSNYSNKINILKETFEVTNIAIGEKVKGYKFQAFLKNLILGYNLGSKVEKSFKTMVTTIINDPGSNISKIEEATKEEQLQGIDYNITFKSDPTKLPIEIKNSKYGQTEHKKRFPNKPSLVFGSKWNPIKLNKVLHLIFRNYLKDKIMYV